ncbi:MAG: MFS transporter [Clostridia bacterium]|nr:MFS transporter [Clostridia bacterium]MBQ9506754.1 MFS transporter [Clostridia bacterium]
MSDGAAKKPLGEKLTDLIVGLKENWNVPKPGEYTSIKEFLFYCLGIMGVCGFTFICNDTVAFTATYLCGSIFEIKMMDFTIITFISLAVKYLTLYVESISMTIFENLGHLSKEKTRRAIIAYAVCLGAGVVCYFIPSAPFEVIIKGLPQLVGNILVITGIGGPVNWFLRYKFCTKYGRYKPFLVTYGIPIAVITCLIPFVPTTLPYTTKLVVLHFLFTLRSRFSALYYDNPKAIVALLTPNSVERQKYYSFGAIFLGGLRSVFRIVFPIMIASTGGYLSVKSYQLFVPILSVFSFGMAFFMIGVKERVASNRETTPKVEFGKSAKSLLRNKYFWIVNIAGVLGLWNAIADGVINYTLIYSLRIEWIVGIASIAGITSSLGNIAIPFLIKRFEKRTIIIWMRAVWALITAGYLLGLHFDNSVWILLFFIFLRSGISAGCGGLTDGLNADILDYHQWKTGERADNMINIFGWFTTPVSTALGFVAPALLKMVGFTSDWDVLFDSFIFGRAMRIYVYLGIVGLILCTIPFFWYDLTREKHDFYVAEIAAREAAAKEVPAE